MDKLLFGGANVNHHIFPQPTSSAMLISAKKRPIPDRPLPVPLGSTPLHVAVKVQAEALADMLVRRGADLYAKNADGLTPVHELLFIDSLSSVKFPILFEGMKNVTVSSFTPLLVSACRDNVDAAERLLEFGEDVESAVGQVSTDDGESPPVELQQYRGYRALHFAVKNRSPRMVKLLLKHNADVLAESDDGSIPLYMSLKAYKLPIGPFVKLLKSDHTLQKRVEEETGVTLLHVACNLRDVGLAEKALKSGTDVNARTFEYSPIWPNSTPLHVSHVESGADESSIGLLQTLLENGADVTMENGDGTPIWQCHNGLYTKNAYKVMDLLMASLHNYSVNPCFGEATHFHIACARNAVTQVEGFLKAGVDVNLTVDYYSEFESGMTPLHCALENNAMEAFDLLMKHGADVGIDDTNGDTPLHLAIGIDDFMDIELFERIIRAGANVNYPNVYGLTPFEHFLNTFFPSKEDVELFVKSAEVMNIFNPVTDQGLIAIVFRNLEDPMELVEIFNNSTAFLGADNMGRSVVHNIVSRNNGGVRSKTEYADIIEKIVSMGCDIDAVDYFGRTPLHSAVQFENNNGVAGLLACGANMNIIDKNGNSAFSYSLNIKNSHENYRTINLLFVKYVDMKNFVGLHCSQKDRESFDRILKLLEVQVVRSDYQGILDRLKLVKIPAISVKLHDFLSETGAVAGMTKFEREIVDEYFQNNQRQLRRVFAMWSGLLTLQHRKAKARVALMDDAMFALRYITESWLDELCYVRIARYLSNEDLKILIDVPQCLLAT